MSTVVETVGKLGKATKVKNQKIWRAVVVVERIHAAHQPLTRPLTGHEVPGRSGHKL